MSSCFLKSIDDIGKLPIDFDNAYRLKSLLEIFLHKNIKFYYKNDNYTAQEFENDNLSFESSTEEHIFESTNKASADFPKISLHYVKDGIGSQTSKLYHHFDSSFVFKLKNKKLVLTKGGWFDNDCLRYNIFGIPIHKENKKSDMLFDKYGFSYHKISNVGIFTKHVDKKIRDYIIKNVDLFL